MIQPMRSRRYTLRQPSQRRDLSTLKVLHVPFCFHPDPVGGTEVYVEALARHLQALGVMSVIAAPWEREAAYNHDGLPVRRFALAPAADPRDIYGAGDPAAAQAFGRILDEEQPDIAHLHAFTRGVSLLMAREAKRRGIPVVFTYHTPTVSCLRGTLLQWGEMICDGRLERIRCARCVLHAHGLSRAASTLVGAMPPAAGTLLGKLGLSGGLWTALRMRSLVALRHQTVSALFHEVDHIVALCQWVKDLLLRNGVAAERLTVCRHGLAQVDAGEARERIPAEARPLRVAFLGRLHPTKGPDTLIRALRLAPDLDVTLDLYGIAQGEADDAYLAQLKTLAAGDTRIVFLPPVPGNEVIALLRAYHLLAVPSRWLETGPLVMLEAFAAGVPVLGSDLGGIAEWVKHGVNGLLVSPDDAMAWGQALQTLDQKRIAQLQSGILPPRGMQDVAREMLALYNEDHK